MLDAAESRYNSSSFAGTRFVIATAQGVIETSEADVHAYVMGTRFIDLGEMDG
jgi:hypothetical protein